MTPLPEKLTLHELRHTFASLLVALGVDTTAVMEQLGHIGPTFSFRVYRHGVRCEAEAKAALRELAGAEDAKASEKAAGALGGRRPKPKPQRARADSNGRPLAPEYAAGPDRQDGKARICRWFVEWRLT